MNSSYKKQILRNGRDGVKVCVRISGDLYTVQPPTYSGATAILILLPLNHANPALKHHPDEWGRAVYFGKKTIAVSRKKWTITTIPSVLFRNHAKPKYTVRPPATPHHVKDLKH